MNNLIIYKWQNRFYSTGAGLLCGWYLRFLFVSNSEYLFAFIIKKIQDNFILLISLFTVRDLSLETDKIYPSTRFLQTFSTTK